MKNVICLIFLLAFGGVAWADIEGVESGTVPLDGVTDTDNPFAIIECDIDSACVRACMSDCADIGNRACSITCCSECDEKSGNDKCDDTDTSQKGDCQP